MVVGVNGNAPNPITTQTKQLSALILVYHWLEEICIKVAKIGFRVGFIGGGKEELGTDDGEG